MGDILAALRAGTRRVGISSTDFTQADITSDLSQVFVVLTNFGGGRRLQFTDDGDGSGGLLAARSILLAPSVDLALKPLTPALA